MNFHLFNLITKHFSTVDKTTEQQKPQCSIDTTQYDASTAVVGSVAIYRQASPKIP